MKIVTPIEKVILTAEEYAIITKAKQILWKMYDNCRADGELEHRTSDIIEHIDLLEGEQGEDYIIEVEPFEKIKVTIEI